MKKDKKNTDYNPEITKEDQSILGDKSGNLRQDGGDDQLLKKRRHEPDFAANNLDIPGASPARPLTNGKPPRDEENEHHGLGTEHNENTERPITKSERE
ncbi:conserved hypothetical protein [Formosa agariphila KMM 3901]|uniref:Uncharacterized protein n=1 Tax=Formosa agariphila (strain DSM 15362 / KCTC 12365 / LMG 23005 / KMM 3901 / M-2Alg 35-1) TaxID=1347342 RepID=T2KLG1_FORAG|nr:hypothetical protein [Formosa agariphila]CDF79278.1 conserved hypothetical protein [Formosa agariphila KMM 3901]